MVKYTFKGGIHPPYNKWTTSKSIVRLEVPQTLYLPLIQHTGKPAKPLVKRGDEVKKGQKIAVMVTSLLQFTRLLRVKLRL